MNATAPAKTWPAIIARLGAELTQCGHGHVHDLVALTPYVRCAPPL